ncbi:hypothetical protein LBJG_01712 [Lactobacillus jensenii 1153]|nr:hypothetical protein LBJG_01712 [Lactobacillus jensenii 1153]
MLLELGFDHFKIPNMIETVGRVMTLKQAAQAMKVSLPVVKERLESAGYQVVG